MQFYRRLFGGRQVSLIPRHHHHHHHHHHHSTNVRKISRLWGAIFSFAVDVSLSNLASLIYQRCQQIIAQRSLSKPEMVYYHRFSVDISTMAHWGWWLGMNLPMDSTQTVIFYVSSNCMKALNYSLLTNVSAEKKTVQQGRFPFVRTDRPQHSCRNENFAFNQNYPARSVKP